MRIRIGEGLLPLNLLAIILVLVIIFFPSGVLQIILGTPFVLFFPGYVLMTALFPKREGMSGIERVALSFGVSLAVVPLIGLILNYTPWGIRLETILCSVASFIFITSIIARFRRNRLPREEHFGAEFHLTLPSWGIGIWGKTLSIFLLLAILGTLGTVGYILAIPKVGESFSEFYILGLEGKTTGYPKGLKVGEEGKVTVGIINHEYETVSYRVEVRINNEKNNEVEPIVIENDGKWEKEIGFILQIAGEKQKVEFLLYKNGEPKPYLEPLRLWVDVTR